MLIATQPAAKTATKPATKGERKLERERRKSQDRTQRKIEKLEKPNEKGPYDELLGWFFKENERSKGEGVAPPPLSSSSSFYFSSFRFTILPLYDWREGKRSPDGE